MALLISVSDLSNYLFCPRKLFYRYIKREMEPPNAGAVKGRVLHDSFQKLIELEKKFLGKRPDIDSYRKFAMEQLKISMGKNAEALFSLGIKPEDCLSDLKSSVDFETERRFGEIKKFVESGDIDLIEPKLRPEFDVKSEKLGLKGRVDCMEMWKDKHIPVDVKSSSFGREVVPLGDKLQVVAYVMILEKMYSKVSVPYGIIRYTRESLNEKVEPEEFLKRKVFDVRDKVIQLRESGKEPEKCRHSFCTVCNNFQKIDKDQ